MRVVAPLFLAALVALAPGCGPDCQSSCQKLYASDDGGCSLPTPGRESDEAIRSCVQDCELALNTPGQIGGYDPLNPSSGTVVELENEKQAAAWMDCIDQSDCRLISDGRCQPR